MSRRAASISIDMFASLCWIAWNCADLAAERRSLLARTRARPRSAARAIPTACAAIPIRPPSSVDIATRKPWCSSPSRRSSGTTASIVEVGGRRRVEAELLLLARHLDVLRVEHERRDAARARRLRIGAGEDEERAGVGAVRDPLLRARDVPAAGDALGARDERAGVRPGAGLGQREGAEHARRAPAAARSRSRCSSVPNASSGSVAADVWTATVTPTPASARESSSSTRAYETKSAPAPPEASGNAHAHQPELRRASRRRRSGNRCSRSQSAAYGSISARANSRVSAWISRCSGLSSNSTAGSVEPTRGAPT